MTDIGRLLTAMVTPFSKTGEVDYSQARILAKGLIESGSDGVVLAGTTGEAPCLTSEEKLTLFAEIKEELGSGIPVIGCTGNYCTSESIELTKRAEHLGVDGFLLTVPYYNKPTQEGLYEHFKAIAASTNLPCILYNVPSRTITSLAPETTRRLSYLDNILGIKEASGNLDAVGQILAETKPGFRVWSGNDNDTFAIVSMGGYGVISVASHLIGNQIKRMINLLREGKRAEAAEEHLRLLPLIRTLFLTSNPVPIKYALNMVGLAVGKPRLPLLPADGDTANQINASLSRYQIDLEVIQKN